MKGTPPLPQITFEDIQWHRVVLRLGDEIEEVAEPGREVLQDCNGLGLVASPVYFFAMLWANFP